MKTSNALLWSVALLGGAVALASAGGGRKAGPPSPAPVPSPPSPGSEGQEELRFYLEEAGFDDSWVIFFEGVAAGESGFNNLTGAGDPALFPPWAQESGASHGETEAAGAAKAYDRNAERLSQCPWPRSRYVFGSGGWFAALPANAVAAFKKTPYACIDPWEVFDPAASVVMAMEQARRLMRYDSFKANPVWLTLRGGWGSVTKMGNPEALQHVAEGHNKFGDRLEQIGVDRSFMFEPVTPLPPKDPAALLERLRTL